MSDRVVKSLLLGGFGAIVGSVMGVAAFGDAVNGAVVFGPIGLFFGWLLPHKSSDQSSSDDSDGAITIETKEDVMPLKSDEMKTVETAINEIIPLFGRMILSMWNLQVKALISIGAISHFLARPWLFVATAIVLLVLVLPLGIIFSIMGMVAMHYGANAKDQFIVSIK